MGAPAAGNPDVVQLRHGLFSVDDARAFKDAVMRAPAKGEKKVVIAVAERFFHEAQNALLKAFEEPPAGTFLVLVLPSEGIVAPTLRSRLLPLPGKGAKRALPSIAAEFIGAGKPAREKLVAKVLDRAKSDKDEEKSAGRADALALLEGLAMAAYESHKKSPSPAVAALLADLDRFIPILHERSAPLKPILEHLLIVAPAKLAA